MSTAAPESKPEAKPAAEPAKASPKGPSKSAEVETGRVALAPTVDRSLVERAAPKPVRSPNDNVNEPARSSKPAPTAGTEGESRKQALAQAVARLRGQAGGVADDTGINAGPARKGEYTVQVSAFQSSRDARSFAGKLESKGYKPFVVTSDINERGTWYRVRIGRFVTADEARSAKTTLAQSDITGWVLRTE